MTNEELGTLLTLLNKFAEENNFYTYPQESLEDDTVQSLMQKIYLQELHRGYNLITELIAYSFKQGGQ